MKHLFAIIALLTALATHAAKPLTNLYDKIPAQGYVGGISLEMDATSPYGSGAVGLSTTHGWMVTSTRFFGGGAGVVYTPEASQAVIPIYAEGRIYFPSEFMRRIYPHVGARVGGQIGTEGGSGLYMQMMGAIRVPLSEKLALNVEIGPQYTGSYTRQVRLDEISYGKPYHSAGNRLGFFIRCGLEW